MPTHQLHSPVRPHHHTRPMPPPLHPLLRPNPLPLSRQTQGNETLKGGGTREATAGGNRPTVLGCAVTGQKLSVTCQLPTLNRQPPSVTSQALRGEEARAAGWGCDLRGGAALRSAKELVLLSLSRAALLVPALCRCSQELEHLPRVLKARLVVNAVSCSFILLLYWIMVMKPECQPWTL